MLTHLVVKFIAILELHVCIPERVKACLSRINILLPMEKCKFVFLDMSAFFHEHLQSSYRLQYHKK